MLACVARIDGVVNNRLVLSALCLVGEEGEFVNKDVFVDELGDLRWYVAEAAATWLAFRGFGPTKSSRSCGIVIWAVLVMNPPESMILQAYFQQIEIQFHLLWFSDFPPFGNNSTTI
jgi:hypothetical protein